jgi:hypothetical protein
MMIEMIGKQSATLLFDAFFNSSEQSNQIGKRSELEVAADGCKQRSSKLSQ